MIHFEIAAILERGKGRGPRLLILQNRSRDTACRRGSLLNFGPERGHFAAIREPFAISSAKYVKIY